MNPILLRWIGAALSALVLLACAYAKGRNDVQVKFNAYKAEVAAAAHAQEEQTRRIEVKNEKATQEASDLHRKQLAVLRSYYAQRLPNSGTGILPQVSGSAPRADGASPDYVSVIPPVDVLASQCAETTLTLTSLQGWVKRVSENTND